MTLFLQTQILVCDLSKALSLSKHAIYESNLIGCRFVFLSFWGNSSIDCGLKMGYKMKSFKPAKLQRLTGDSLVLEKLFANKMIALEMFNLKTEQHIKLCI